MKICDMFFYESFNFLIHPQKSLNLNLKNLVHIKLNATRNFFFLKNKYKMVY
jgi:hypothetical protein